MPQLKLPILIAALIARGKIRLAKLYFRALGGWPFHPEDELMTASEWYSDRARKYTNLIIEAHGGLGSGLNIHELIDRRARCDIHYALSGCAGEVLRRRERGEDYSEPYRYFMFFALGRHIEASNMAPAIGDDAEEIWLSAAGWCGDAYDFAHSTQIGLSSDVAGYEPLTIDWCLRMLVNRIRLAFQFDE